MSKEYVGDSRNDCFSYLVYPGLPPVGFLQTKLISLVVFYFAKSKRRQCLLLATPMHVTTALGSVLFGVYGMALSHFSSIVTFAIFCR